ncbi:hypothetical protein [Pedobacter cryoconitis]|uniref:BZIP transcription factor n=1 Tax=Pedobacter cryoconitis TaxID=188932 RepID=A0A7X0J3M1_9SPHI|nr:hypothetical protein [Pedobacter cryoconitis]MBB6499792.1 hypothetical protein [Pedobacter cryoconitis]
MKKVYLSLTAVFAFVCYSQAQITTDPSGNIGIGITSPAAKLDVNGSGNFTGPLQVGGSAVNSNTTKLFIRNNYGEGKNWALSAGANMITEHGFALYNWTDFPTRPLLFIGNDGSAIINNISGGTLTLQKNSTHIPALIFQGVTSATSIEAGDDYLTTYLGGSRRLTILSNGNVGIGTDDQVNFNLATANYKLAVAGKFIAEEVNVKLKSTWPDYVFKPSYNLLPIAEVKSYIDQNQHLPGMPSAQDVGQNGLNLGEMNRLLVQKVEELTLYLIAKDKEVREQQEALSRQEDRLGKLEEQLNKLYLVNQHK